MNWRGASKTPIRGKRAEEGLENLPTQKTNYQALVKKHLEEIEASDRDAAVGSNARWA